MSQNFNGYLGDGFYLKQDPISMNYILITPYAGVPPIVVEPPHYFQSTDEFLDHVSQVKEREIGQYRKASPQGNSGATQGPNQSAGRPGQVATGPVSNQYTTTNAVIPSASQGPTAQQMMAQTLQAQAALHHYIAQQQQNIANGAMGGLGNTYQNQLTLAHAARAPQTPAPPHAKTDLKTSDMVVGEIIAYRVWYIDRLRLRSATADVYWYADKPMVGDPASGYGIHAYKDRTACFRDSYASNESSRPYVFGEVALWGDVIEHEDGYRAEFARPHRFLVWHPSVNVNDQHSISTIYLCEKQDKAA